MRVYTWKEKSSGRIVEVQRKISDYRVPPSAEESGFEKSLDGRELQWVKLVDIATITGNLQKGNYGRC